MNTLVLERGITIVVDGGCLNNQFPTSERHMYGSFAVYVNGKRSETITYQNEKHTSSFKWECDDTFWLESLPDVPPSNNVAEMEMFCGAISYLDELSSRTQPEMVDKTKVRILTDSALVVGYLTDNWKVKSPHLKLHVEQARQGYLKLKWMVDIRHVDNLWVKSILGH